MSNLRGSLYLLVGTFIVVIIICIFATDTFSLHPLILSSSAPADLPLLFHSGEAKPDDTDVLDILQRKYLTKPSSEPYNLTEPDVINPSMGQAERIDMILNRKKNGFFIECGALDGEIRSNTLFFERERGWRGLLIEADPKNVQEMLLKHRKAYVSNACLSPSENPITVTFQPQQNMGHIVSNRLFDQKTPNMSKVFEAQCFPLMSFIKALDIPSIDYFSLDVEGAEFEILKTIPWHLVDIKTLSVEFIHDSVSKEDIKSFMEAKGYITHSEITRKDWLANDFIFVRRDIFENMYNDKEK